MQRGTTSASMPDVSEIGHMDPEAWQRLAQTELESFLDMLSQLEPDDWNLPTPCTLWSVRDLVAHQAAHARIAGFRGLLTQASPFATRGYRKRGMSTNDALNQAQVEHRRALPVEEVIAELSDLTPAAIASRTRLSWPARQLRLPVPPAGMMRLDRLLIEIFPRDMWIHRLDIADATGKPFQQRPEHEGVLVGQVIGDVAQRLQRNGPGISLSLRLDGVAGGTWKLGRGTEMNLSMDVTDFMRLTSGRLSAEEVFQRVICDATPAVTGRVLEGLLAPY